MRSIHGYGTVSTFRVTRALNWPRATRNALRVAFLVAISSASLVAAQQTPQEVRVNFLSQGEPDTIDPSRTTFAFAIEAAIVRQVFEPLLRFDENLVPQPAAADRYDVSPDGTLYTFHLRRDGRW